MDSPANARAPKRVVVVGGGLTGLACAFHLARAGVEVRVLEAAAAPGGVVGSFELEGFRFERGPNTVQSTSAEFRRLSGELGLASRMVVSPARARERYLWHAGRLRALPGHPLALLASSLLSVRGRLRVASEPLRRMPAPAPQDDPDLERFFSERLGREAALRLAGAFVRGVYAAELSELGARSAFPKLWQACVAHGGLVRALWNRERDAADLPGPRCSSRDLLSFEEGLGELVGALAQAMGARLKTDSAVAALARAGSRWSVATSGGAREEADVVVLALPAAPTARLLAALPGLEPAAAVLAAVRHARVTLVHLGFAAGELPGMPRGFGYLVPPGEAASEAPRVLGTIFTSNLFEGRAPRDGIGVTSFYATDTCAAWGADALPREACADLARALRLSRVPTPRVSRVESWDGVIPRYAPGHRDRIDALERELAAQAPGLVLAGNYSGGVSVEQVLTRGREVAAGIASGGRS